MPHHVLIIEDELAIAETLIYAFKEAGIATTHLLLGGDAVDAFKNNQHAQFNFVILDIGLPDITGFDVCKKIRQISTIPILFLTARNHEIDKIVGLEIGADDYVTKPFSPREVVARVNAILRRTEFLSSTKPKGFLVDEHSNRIQFNGQFLTLTRYEFMLLKTLINQPNRVFSRNQLMDLLWVNAEDTFERTVDAHIKTLRAKLRLLDTANTLIVTHRGMGYSLLA